MKTKFINTVLFTLLSLGRIFAQDVTTVRANSADISDNLDLQAVASIFGDSQDLEDFERRLNDPNTQISNLDLNNDNRVDYLRVIEVTQKNTHVIILQAVLAADTFQDVATIEVERDRNNNVSVQVVGDTYMYGPNYIYEPVYVSTPVLFNLFWVSSYRPYYSPWYYGYYPTYYNYWAPYPAYRYRNHVHVYINTRNSYNYVNVRRSTRAVNLYNGRRTNGYERQHPNNSFTSRNANVTNRYQLDQNRASTRSMSRSTGNALRSGTAVRANGTMNTRSSGTRDINTVRDGSQAIRSSGTAPAGFRNADNTRSTAAPAGQSFSTRNNDIPSVRNSAAPTRSYSAPQVRNTQDNAAAAPAIRNSTPAVRSIPNNNSMPAVRSNPGNSMPAVRSTPAQAAPRQMSAPSGGRQSSSGGRRG